ncbi:MAG TPA: adenylate/guanylate cyclase domain-containing protein [Terriglobales bacterium]|nr:adenylate/guanylate cyclase domain-containing protein [Terriglobales bacterium]
MARLIISAPDGKRGILEITKPVLTVGRGSGNDLVLDHSSVSRLHAVLKLEADGSVVIADRGSTNGVLVNSERITREAKLANGDELVIGAYGLKFEHTAEGALRVEKVEVPSTVNDVLRAPVKYETPHAPDATAGSVDDLLAQLRKLEREKYLLTVLYDAGKALSARLSVDDIAEQVMNLAFRIEGVQRGFMMLFDERGGVQRQTEVRYRVQPTTAQPQISLSRSVLDLIKQQKQPILVSDASADERFTGSESMKISGLQSAMCAPLLGKERLLGIFYVDNLQATAAFTQEELNVFALVAAQAAAAIDSAVTHEALAKQAVQRSALERFLSPDVVEMIAANPNVRLGGSNQVVTVLFSDIRGFTTMSEKLPPEKVVEILNEYFTRVTDVIFDNGGMLDKYLGDGVMAVFGAPISKGNDAANAVRAGIEIQKLVLQLNLDSKARQWPELRVGVGINTGIVTAGNIGSPRRIDYTVVGDTVNVASRLMSNAAGWQILISESTAQSLGPEIPLEPLAPLQVKGKSQPLSVFSVQWAAQKAGAR